MGWSDRVGGELERAIAGGYVGELCRSLMGGIDLGPCESIALGQMWLEQDDIRDTLRVRAGLPLAELSMGMSNDFEVAVEEGATLVRIGTTLFEGLSG